MGRGWWYKCTDKILILSHKRMLIKPVLLFVSLFLPPQSNCCPIYFLRLYMYVIESFNLIKVYIIMALGSSVTSSPSCECMVLVHNTAISARLWENQYGLCDYRYNNLCGQHGLFEKNGPFDRRNLFLFSLLWKTNECAIKQFLRCNSYNIYLMFLLP